MRVSPNVGGRPRKPTPIKEMQGLQIRGRKAEPKLSHMQIPPAPAELDEVEREAWESLRAEVNLFNATTSADIPAFEMMAVSLATYRKAVAALRELGITMDEVGVKGQPYKRKRPEVDVMIQMQKLVWIGFQKFGLSPSDRSRVQDLVGGEADGGGEGPRRRVAGRFADR